MKSKAPVTATQRRRLEAGLHARIRHYQLCLNRLGRVDAEVLATGFEALESYENFALWLCSPQRGLGGKIPLDAMKTAAGRQQVRRILNAIEHGVYL